MCLSLIAYSVSSFILNKLLIFHYFSFYTFPQAERTLHRPQSTQTRIPIEREGLLALSVLDTKEAYGAMQAGYKGHTSSDGSRRFTPSPCDQVFSGPVQRYLCNLTDPSLVIC